MSREKDLLDRIFETEVPVKFNREKLAVLDAFSQFSQNPTSMSAGYGIEENCSLISLNLKKRYNLRTTENIITFLRGSIEEMIRINDDLYFWEKAIANYLKEKFIDDFLNWYNSLYKRLTDQERQQFLFLLYSIKLLMPYNCSVKNLQKWFYCFFDKEEALSSAKLEDLIVQYGLGNFLYYRSSRGNESIEFVPFLLLDELEKNFKNPVSEEQIEDFFEKLTINNVKELEKCSKETPPVIDIAAGGVAQTAPLVVECSKSYSAISPFALKKIKELIKTKKENLTKEWKTKISDILNYFTEESYPFVDSRKIFEREGTYCWEITYIATPDKKPIKVGILLSPYIFPLTRYSNILDELQPYPLILIFY
jgi:hypothetical protein